jgi:histidinol-phosphate phosphatase family protein
VVSAPTTLVVPTLGRPSLGLLLEALADQSVPVDAPVHLVDDRPWSEPLDPLALSPRARTLRLLVLRSGGGGPARARNLGWRHARTPWVSFLDDDVLPSPTWYADLLRDLADPAAVVGSSGRLEVPLQPGRRPTDWERGTAGLAASSWITADLSYRRAELARAGGFDERFPRAFREDADLALRLGADRGGVARGDRLVLHPVRPADDWVSLRQQAGNRDDALMRRLHGSGWHARARAPRGRLRTHVATTAALALGLGAAAARRRRTATVLLGAWSVATAAFAWSRIAPGPRDAAEVRRMVLTSLAIPPAATWHRVVGEWQHRSAGPWHGLPDLVLLDRDGTIVEDVPYNGDPEKVRPVPGAREALERLRASGLRLAVVSNQSGVARGLLAPAQVRAVNDRVEELLGPFDGWFVCPHGEDEGCECRKPRPGLVCAACDAFGVDPATALVIGDIGSDAAAARAAGARSLLVPTPATRCDELGTADSRVRSLPVAVDLVLGGRW